jgi:hypothetical protein
MSQQADVLGWLAAAGWGYGVLSDVLGEMRSVPVNSVARLLLLIGAKLLRMPAPLPVDRRHVAPAVGLGVGKYGGLINTGWRLRASLLKDPTVRRVDVGLMGEHLVLTVYKDSKNAGGVGLNGFSQTLN